ncbi:hypothetical protein M3P21_17145 [Ruegeria sp. 2012CJ41-6]|uniref:Haloacid dehalogenase-like hydrolase n=1 Tax=Ruegeria spongiae TaxID=2942209 RepID=A0ABT0Q782_9RHOB|nr:hypothetical protein [Ruegeria spongiae]MCL6285257.1 hypothetical protein [Ruegeria spongiae]
MAPERAARTVARRQTALIQSDDNNFSAPRELNTLLMSYEVVSFDLFDTLVWRTVALADVHRKTSEFADRFLSGDDGPLPRELLLHARGRFQQMVKQRGMAQAPTPRNEVDLRDVFDGALAPYIRRPDRRARAVQALLDYEIETERQVLVVDPEMRDFLVMLRNQGKTLILASDMYLSEDLLRRLLIDLGLWDLFDHVFVSASVGVTKHSGLLFAHMDETLGLSDKRRFHLGDNWTNDVERPRAFGWDALHYFNPENERRKLELEKSEQFGAHLQARAARELLGQMKIDSARHGMLRLVAATFSLFSRQVLETAVAGGYDRVFFLTRDGTLFHELARQFLAGCGAGGKLPLPKMAELAFSRRVGLLLNYPEIDQPHWANYLRDNAQFLSRHPASLRGIMKSFGLGVKDLRVPDALRAEVEDCLASDDPETDIGFDILRKTRPDIMKPLHAALIARRDRIRCYVDEMGLLNREEKILLVDIGYSGTAVKSLSEYINLQERSGQTVRSRLSLMMLAANRFLPGNLSRLHPRINIIEPAIIGRKDELQRAVAISFAWLEPFTVDRTRGSLRDFIPGPYGELIPYFALPTPTGDGGVDRTTLLAAAGEFERMLRCSPLPAGCIDQSIIQMFTARFARPRRSTIRSMQSVTHHAGATEVRENSVILPIRPLHLRCDIRTCVSEDHWVQGSLKASGFGWLVPFFNKYIARIT